MHKKGVVLLYLVLLVFLLPFAYAEIAKINPTKFVVLNELSPDIAPASLDYYVGTFNSEGKNYIARTLLFFDINQIKDIKNKHISNAYIELDVSLERDFMTDSAYDVSVHKVIERWVTATWNARPEFDNSIAAKTTLLGNGRYIINIKNIVNDWLTNPSFNYGVLIKGIDEDKTNDANLKQIESINLVVEYEDANECNKNNGVCRNECGNNEEEAKYGCGFLSGERCCVKKEIIGVTTTTIPIKEDIAIQEIREIGEQEEKQPLSLQCTKCPDVNKDGKIDINDLTILGLKQGSNELDYDLDGNGVIDKKDLECVARDFNSMAEDIALCKPEIEDCYICAEDLEDDDLIVKFQPTPAREEVGFAEELSPPDSSKVEITDGWVLEAEGRLLVYEQDMILGDVFNILKVKATRRADIGPGISTTTIRSVGIEEKGFTAWRYEKGRITARAELIENKYNYPPEITGSSPGVGQLPERSAYAIVHKYTDQYRDGKIAIVRELRYKKVVFRDSSLKVALHRALDLGSRTENENYLTYYGTSYDGEKQKLWTISTNNRRKSIFLEPGIRQSNIDAGKKPLRDGEIEKYTDNGKTTKFIRRYKESAMEVKVGKWSWEVLPNYKESYWEFDNANGMLIVSEGRDPVPEPEKPKPAEKQSEGRDKITGQATAWTRIIGMQTVDVPKSGWDKPEQGGVSEEQILIEQLENDIRDNVNHQKRLDERLERQLSSKEGAEWLLRRSLRAFIGLYDGRNPENSATYKKKYFEIKTRYYNKDKNLVQIAGMKLAEASIAGGDVETALWVYRDIIKTNPNTMTLLQN